MGWDDLIAAGVGAVAGVAGQAISDIKEGHVSHFEDYAGAVVGGAVAGVAVEDTGNPALAGAAAPRQATP